MTDQYTTPAPVPASAWGTPPTPAPEKPKVWWKKPIFVLPVACLVLGTGLGMANRPDPERVEVPGPERIVEKPVEKIVEKPVTPASCLKALDLADEAFGYAAQAMGYMSAALTAAGNLDAAAIKQAGTDLDAVTPKLKAMKDPMQAAKTECRATTP